VHEPGRPDTPCPGARVPYGPLVSVPEDRAPRPSWSGDAAAERLFARVRSACDGGEDLPTRLEAGLRAALGLLADEPELAYELTVAPYLGADEAALDGLRYWLGCFGALLRGAAEDDPRAATSELTYLAPFLIGGVRFQIARLIIGGEGSDLRRLLPGTLEALLAYYFEPGEPQALARAALGGSVG
jgi:hypothetical protein